MNLSYTSWCEVCGTQFDSKRQNAKYCSNRCCQRAYRKRIRGNHEALLYVISTDEMAARQRIVLLLDNPLVSNDLENVISRNYLGHARTRAMAIAALAIEAAKIGTLDDAFIQMIDGISF